MNNSGALVNDMYKGISVACRSIWPQTLFPQHLNRHHHRSHDNRDLPWIIRDGMTAEIPCINLPDSWRADCAVPEGQECATCSWNGKWDELLARLNTFEPLWITREQLQQSLAIGGRLCCAVLLALMDKAQGGLKSAVELYAYTLTFYPKTQDEPYGLSVFAVSDDGAFVPGAVCVPHKRLPIIDTASERSVEWAKRQINKCLTKHEQCTEWRGSFLPSRLIHIPSNAEDGVVLRSRHDIKPGAKYAALSHCWGESEHWPQCLTTLDTLRDRMEHIAWSTIPQTFRQAILFTRRLGLEYIWIDSVCIIQRDEKDWEAESVLMQSVYSNAYVTITALASHNSHEGLFHPQQEGAPSCLLTTRWRDSKQYLFVESMFLRSNVVSSLANCLDSPGSNNSHETAEYPLLERAWTFQERLVSPRTLMFGRGQLFLECCSGRIAESYPHRSDEEYEAVFNGDIHGSKVIRQIFADAVANSVEDATTLWRDLVRFYSFMKITKLTDRLPAISAVAKQLQMARPTDEYICGVWRKSLHEDLLWANGRNPLDNSLYPTVTYEPYVAPSWSWASYPEPITFDKWHKCSEIHLVENNVEAEYGDTCGRVLPGSHILVRGRVMDVCWLPYWVPLPPRPDDLLSARGWGLTRKQHFWWGPKQTERPRWVSLSLDYSDYKIDWYARMDHMVQVRLLQVAKDHWGGPWSLVLHQDPSTGRYRRIGWSTWTTGMCTLFVGTPSLEQDL